MTISFDEILTSKLLHAVFQPIVSMGTGESFGFEGLIRGPEESAYHSPAILFQAAQQLGRLQELESSCRETVLEHFARLELPGRLFMNMGPNSFHCIQRQSCFDMLDRLGVRPERIVLEITETEAIHDYVRLRATLDNCREHGFMIAIDDLGAGYSGLRLWSEIHPDFVKVDKHFTSRIAVNRMKLNILDSIQSIAQKSRTKTIAEGIENEEDMLLLARAGFDYGQGFFLGRPTLEPHIDIDPAIKTKLLRHTTMARTQVPSTGTAVTVASILRNAPTFSPSTTVDTVLTSMINNPQQELAAVLDQGRPVGIIDRMTLLDDFARPYQRELLGKKPCTVLMKAQPLVFDIGTPMQDVSLALTNADPRHFSNGFAVTRQGRYAGLCTGHDVMREITQMQVSAARYANPLTQLPGNVPINEVTDRLLSIGSSFVVCYADLDNFKPYNDIYGYRQGDDVIMMTSRTLAMYCDPDQDFLGHIGGDDFLLLFQSSDWESRCRRILETFSNAIEDHLKSEDWRAGGYMAINRVGDPLFHPIPSLSLGLVKVEPNTFTSHAQLSAATTEAKKQAKLLSGNSLFIERRTFPSFH